LCKMIHGEDSTQKVINASSLIFWDSKSIGTFDDASLKMVSEEVKKIEISEYDFSIEGIISHGTTQWFFKSKNEAKTLLETNAISINGIKINKFDFLANENHRVLLKVWKKTFCVIEIIY
jgi:tyrosyl-tRNA synthetase